SYKFFDVWAVNERPTQDIDLLIDIGLNCKPAHERLQDRLGVDPDASRGFIAVRHVPYHKCRDNPDGPGDTKTNPAPLPDPAQGRQCLLYKFVHGITVRGAPAFAAGTAQYVW